MKRRHLFMLAGLLGSGCLVVFGDKTPANSISEPVAQPSPSNSAIVTPPPHVTTEAGKDDSQRMILTLTPRSELLRKCGWTPRLIMLCTAPAAIGA